MGNVLARGLPLEELVFFCVIPLWGSSPSSGCAT